MTNERDSAQATLCDEEKFKDFSDVDSEEQNLSSLASRSRPYRTALIVFSAAVVSVVLIYFTTTWLRSPHPKYIQCGTTSDEARERGCVFETTGFTWLTPECADPDTEAEFLTYIVANDLKLYRDMNYTEEVPIEEVRRGNGPGFFVHERYHLTHCLFLMKKLHRMRDAGKMIDGQIMPLHHTEHCMGQNLQAHAEPGFREHEPQFSYTKFPYCGKPGGYKVAWGPNVPLWTDY